MSSGLSNTTLASRLTLWYTTIFTCTFVLVFFLTYLLISAVLNSNTLEDLEEDIAEMSIFYNEGGIDSVWEQVNKEVASDGEEHIFFRLLDARGSVIRSSDMSSWNALDEPLDIQYNPQIGTMTTTRISHQDYEFDIQTGYASINENLVLQLGFSLEENSGFLDIIRNIFLFTTPILVLLASMIGWFLARKALSGLDILSNTAISISRGKFDERVPYSDHGEEINRLARTFNAMLDKIQALLTGMRDITDNIAHDLRSPLTRIRGEAEAILTSQNKVDAEELRHVLANTIEESDRLLNMINTMLDITETEAGLMKTNKSAINISDLVNNACDLFQPLATNQQIDFRYDTESGLTMNGNASFLQRLIGNLIDNALKYTQPGGKVRVSLQKVRDMIEIEVRDTGIGIKEDEKDKIFTRFYRSDASRTKPGNGLGLCLARAIARAHWGEIQVQNNPDQGSVFRVILPQSHQ